MSFRRQLARPRGALGLLAGEVLAWSNRELNAWTVSLLAPASNARVLEIGFGPGVGVRLAAMRARRGLVAGIDPSSMMLRRARFRNRTRLRRARLDLRRGSVAALPWPDRSFTHAFAVNSFFEWPDPARGLAEVARVLRSGGHVALTTQARWAHDAAEVEAVGRRALAMLEAAGFVHLRMEERAVRPHAAVCLLGRLPV
jgi:ubiquinone/menaquinone biosynthesis C-methylase UbiE